MPYDRDFFHIDWDEEESELITPLQEKALNRVAKEVVDRQMAVPVIMFLESVKPLNWVASQLMLFLEPFYAWIFGFTQIIDFRRALGKRESIPMLIEKIEMLEVERMEKRREERKKKQRFWKKVFKQFRGKKNG